MPAARRTVAAMAGAALLGIPALAACSSDSGADTIKVSASDGKCEVAKTDWTAGKNTLKVTNKGKQITEVYVYAQGDRIVTERENIGPGISADITFDIKPGKYQVACKPGMKGDGIRQDITVAGVSSEKPLDPRLAKAVADYRAYVQSQVDTALPTLEQFTAAVKSGDAAKAKELYASSRYGWESVEPVAESFGDLDPKMDAREADLEPGQEFTGWHRLEKALWTTGQVAPEEYKYADQLLADYKDLQAKIGTAEITPTSIANGAKELLDEVATGKVTGEEEFFSHTDLVDFDGNVAGARKAFELLKPVVLEKDPELDATLTAEFVAIDQLLAKYRQGSGYVAYDTVNDEQRKELSDAVNALAEPLSRLAAAIAS
ncbi:EfeM/EfeO family lipoprotein [Yinghuangia sp. ASG 101]|uniref:iron uptake system protein EfeO n=1 Tax=Yinghuangia sp. ASG 101 TaxID=2896848 RepID=UPI001E58F890|nr:iron uptake system protein EfeO [Yinghuangia sp. ASG 101]UGQ11675.1 EfeM/EfeO family lipoprotein [Yinghuangia sp. ASG 101]